MSKNWEKYDPTLGDVKDGNCYKRAYCLIFNKLYSEIRHLAYNTIVSALEQGEANYDFTGKTIAEFNKPGLWVVETHNHVTVVKDGIMYDAEEKYLNGIIEEAYEFPNRRFTDYSKYNIQYADYRIGGIMIFAPDEDVIRIPLRATEVSEEETLQLINQAFQEDNLPKVYSKDINQFILPNIDQIKQVQGLIDETAIWIKTPSGYYIYKKDGDVLVKTGVGSFIPVVMCKEDFGKKVKIEILDNFYEAIRLLKPIKSYILLKAINATSKDWLIKNNIEEINYDLK